MSSKLLWIGRVISILVSLQFAFSGVAKLFPRFLYPQMPEQMVRLGLPGFILMPIGLVELMCVVIYALPSTAVLGAVLFTGYLGGAILTHLRIGDPIYLPVLLGIMVWLGLYLREPRLHALLPLRKLK